VNNLRSEDFVEVKPGEALNPYSKVGELDSFANYLLRKWKAEKPGKYVITFTYSTAAESDVSWHGDFSGESGAKLKKMLEKVPRITVKSAPVVVEYVKDKK